VINRDAVFDVSEEQVRRKQKEAANYGGSIEAATAACDLLPPGQEIIAAEFHTRSELNQPYVWKLP
jgi:hypothetical protein